MFIKSRVTLIALMAAIFSLSSFYAEAKPCKKNTFFKRKENKKLALNQLKPEYNFDAMISDLEDEVNKVVPPEFSSIDLCCSKVFLSADFIYWRAQNYGRGYAFDRQPPDALNIGAIYFGGESKYNKFEWNPGFKVALGCKTWYDQWNLNAIWTRYHVKSDLHDKPFTFSVVYGYGFKPLFELSEAQASGDFSWRSSYCKYKLNLDIIDLHLGKVKPISSKIEIAPYLALRGAIINQYFDDLVMGYWRSPDFAYMNKSYSKYWGIGPKIGFDTNINLLSSKYHLSTKFNLVTKLAASLLYGKLKARSISRLKNWPGGLVDEVWYQTGSDNQDYTPMNMNVNVALGFDWSRCFCNKQLLNLALLWEVNYFWDQFFIPFTDMRPSTGGEKRPPYGLVFQKPLSLEGLTFNVSFHF